MINYFICLVCLFAIESNYVNCCQCEDSKVTPPTITCKHIKSKYHADKGKKTTTVTWETPTAEDPDDGKLSVKLVSGKQSGSEFGQGDNVVVYTATDSDGLKDFCFLQFYVEVRTCRPVHMIKNGQVQCTGNIYGSTCDFECEDGYSLNGKRQIECLKNKKWNADDPKCLAKTCRHLEDPEHGLDHQCTNNFTFGSACWLVCDKDNGYAAVWGQWTQCNRFGKWAPDPNFMKCEDVKPPELTQCPTKMILKTKNPTDPNTLVEWLPVSYTDNSGEEIRPETLNPGARVDGGVFSVGWHSVKFTAKDSNKNKAEACHIFVHVSVIECSPPHFHDENLEIVAPCVDFQEGKTCGLKCYLSTPLIGSKSITCNQDGNTTHGYWDWGQNDNPPQKKPRCYVPTCPKLRAPNHGAMICDKWFRGEFCQLQCKESHDIAESKRFRGGLYMCSTSGRWNMQEVPNCQEREHPTNWRMREHFYFSGSCHEHKEEIRDNFITAVTEMDVCPNITCSVENIEVRCGDEPIGDYDDVLIDKYKRKRRAHPGMARLQRPRSARRHRGRKYQYVSFNVVIPVDKLKGSFSETKTNLKKRLVVIGKRISKIRFRAAARLIRPWKVRIKQPLPVCRPGLKIGIFHRDSCVPCSVGSYHDLARDECMACPLGQYQEKLGQMTCDKCSQGKTTLTIANSDESSCQEMCGPGAFSHNGVVPCSKCPLGSYQMKQNATSCHMCPVGLTTISKGTISKSKCIPYDILLKGPVSLPVEGKTPSEICDFTFAVWIKVVETSYDGIKFQIYSSITGVGLEVSISSDVEVYINGNHHVQVLRVVERKWIHVGVVWSKKTVTVYIGGIAVQTRVLSKAPTCLSPSSSVMRVEIRDHAYIYLRDLNFLTNAKPKIMSRLASSCNSYLVESLFTLEQMDIHTLSKVNEVIPSTCLRPDPCSTSPCGSNVCIPRGDSFFCACRGGYSGEKCEIPPDYCEDNFCRNNATCMASTSSFVCDCKPGFRGTLCEQKIADGGWSGWMDWSGCSVSCGNGTRIRHRFCTNPPPDRDGKPCEGRNKEKSICQMEECPECDESTLVLGKGVIKTCLKKEKSIICSVECELGKVFPEKPFNYTCNMGIWTPTRQTVSCTDPVTPLTAGINYTVVFDNSLTSHNLIASKLTTLGRTFQCSTSGDCAIDVGSATCSQHIAMCQDFKGNYYGSLIVERAVPAGKIDFRSLQQNNEVMTYLSPLFVTWNVFSHTSDETESPDHRALEINLQNDTLSVHPYDNPSLAFEVPGQFGEIMKTWKHLDDTNWEVRDENYTDFQMITDDQEVKSPTFLSAVQIMTCPTGAVQGGVFCMKCPPGTRYAEKQCIRCRHGFYQDKPGMSSCKPCPGFKSTELLGSPKETQCHDAKVSDLKMLLGLRRPGFGVLDLHTMAFDIVNLKLTKGNAERIAYNPRDGFIYYTTQSPRTIGRVTMDGRKETVLIELPNDTFVTGLDVDVGSGLLFYTTFRGALEVFHIDSSAHHTLLSNLSKPRDLVLDQNFGLYWAESNTIKHLTYNSKVANTVVRDKYAVWNPTLQDDVIMWQSFARIRSAHRNGSNTQTLATNFTSSFGMTDEYYFHTDAEEVIIRLNKDLSASAPVFSFTKAVGRTRLVNTTDDSKIDNLCSSARSDCEHGCFPLNETSRICFCAADHTLQKDFKICRRDFSVTMNTSDWKTWSKPLTADYSVPPSMTLRLKVKSCHSARVALAETGRGMYRVELGQKRGNVTEISLKKISRVGPPIVLDAKEVDLLDCNQFKTFWFTWQKKKLSIGVGDSVGRQRHIVAADFRPYNIDSVMFSSGINSTATWFF